MEKIRENMFKNTEYMDWLIGFTEKNPIFSDQDWLYNEEDISKEDNDKVKNLPFFFEGIHSFANRNYLSSNKNEYGENYLIQKEDAYLRVGYIIGSEMIIYCQKEEKQPNSINFYSVINENLPMRTMYVDNKLQKISDDLKELMITLNVPVEFVKEMVENTQEEIDLEKVYRKK